MNVYGRVAAITGAGSGMGRALAVRLADRGCHLALSDIDENMLAETARLVKPGVKVTHTVVDVADAEAVRAWAQQVVDDHGAVHLVFNNAGVALATRASDHTAKDRDWQMGINFGGVVNGTMAFMPFLQQADTACVINTSSVFGIIAFPTMSLYNASKFAVRGYTEALQQELAIEGSPVRAVLVMPGGVKTGIARASRVDPQLVGTYVREAQQGAAEFERFFRLSPDQAAEQILTGVETGRERILVGRDAKVIDWLQRLMPSRYKRLVRWVFKRRIQRNPPDASLTEPTGEAAVQTS